MTRSENLNWPPGRPLGSAFDALIASSSNHTVTSPRFLSDASYPGQFFTLYLVLYFGVTLLFVLAAIERPPHHLSACRIPVNRPRRELEPCTNAVGPASPA